MDIQSLFDTLKGLGTATAPMQRPRRVVRRQRMATGKRVQVRNLKRTTNQSLVSLRGHMEIYYVLTRRSSHESPMDCEYLCVLQSRADDRTY
jgi:hypothetical protein